MFRKNQKRGWSFVLVFLCFSCDTTEDESCMADCASLRAGIIGKDIAVLETEINNLSADLERNPTSSDPLGHELNLETLVSLLNDQCESITAEIRCYACIETLPVQSEILLHTDSSGTLVSRVMDILTPDNDIMTLVGVHE